MSDIDAEFRARRLAYGGGFSYPRRRRSWSRILCIALQISVLVGVAVLGILNAAGFIGVQ